MVLSAQHIVAFTRHSVSAPSQLCWTVLRGGWAKLIPALIAIWTRLPELIHLLTSKVRVLEYQSLYIGWEKEAVVDVQIPGDHQCLVTCDVLYSPQQDRQMDIIFIHGLHGSTMKTWRQGDWNIKYQEVQKVPLRKTGATDSSTNHDVCPHCHLETSQKRKSFCNMSDLSETHPPTTMRSYSVPDNVYKSSFYFDSNSSVHNIPIQESNDSDDDDILSFLVGDHKESNNSPSKDNIIPCSYDIQCDNSSLINNQTLCDISDKITGDTNNEESFASLAIDDCDIEFFNDYIADSVKNLRAMCDTCTSKYKDGFIDDNCDKCLKIESLLIDNIRSNDTLLPDIDEDFVKNTVKRKFEKNDGSPTFTHYSYDNIKLRKIDNMGEEYINKNSCDEYADAESEFYNIMKSNDILNNSDLQSDNSVYLNMLHINKSDDHADTASSNSTHSVDENFNVKHFCTCNKENKTNIHQKKLDTVTEELSNCWPKDWLPLDYPNARIISLSYTTDQYLWRPMWIKPYTRSSLQDRSNEMVEKLSALGVGNKPVIWVGHSKGGLFIKEIFSSGYESKVYERNRKEYENIYNNTKALVLYSVPHRGSPLANITFPPLLRVSSELEEIQHESEFVLKLHSRFVEALKKGHVDPTILSYCETRRTLMGAIYLTIVSTHSADPGVGHMYYGVSLDHREICKPTSRTCFIYKDLLSVIGHVQKNISEGNSQA